jgi:hypothetical protein
MTDKATVLRIAVSYDSIDRFHKRRVFRTIEGARRFAHRHVGPHPDRGSFYAVSDDGIGKITVTGLSLDELFPAPVKAAAEGPDDDFYRFDWEFRP